MLLNKIQLVKTIEVTEVSYDWMEANCCCRQKHAYVICEILS